MRRFIKFFFASCLGTLAALALIVLIFMVIGMSASSQDSTVKKGSVLVLDFKQFIPEKTNNVVEQPYNFEDVEYLGLRRIKKVIRHAKDDDRIAGILLDTKFAYQDQVKVYNLREVLEEYKESGKFLYAYSDFYTQPGYQISSLADSIFLNPNGAIDLKGFSVMYPFYKDALDKLGIKMNIFYAGQFKSATEPFRRNSMSDENKLQYRSFINELNKNLVSTISTDRKISEQDVLDIQNTNSAFIAEKALASGLVDGLLYWDEVEAILKAKLGIKESKEIKTISLNEYSSKIKLSSKSKSKDKIAIVYAEGEIGYGKEAKGAITNEQYIKLINKLRDKSNIKAIVLRVNSPGGNGFSSDVIWRELDKTSNEGKPIIASMGSYAASGGYYISAMADTIVAEPTTLTGSIGVFIMFPNVRELLSEKIGIQFDTVATSAHAAGLNPMFDLSSDQQKMLQDMTDQLYDQFLERVAEGRDMTKEEVHKIAQGRVWTGTQAKKLGLVDELGDLEDAIEIAAAKAGLEDYKIVEYPVIKENPWKKIISSFASETKLKVDPIGQELKELYPYYKNMKSWMLSKHPQARLPIIIQ